MLISGWMRFHFCQNLTRPTRNNSKTSSGGEVKNIEVEYSGPLDKEQAKDLIEFFDGNGEKVTTRHRVLIDYSTFLGDGLKNRKKDIRLRITNGVPEIIVNIPLRQLVSISKRLYKNLLVTQRS